MSLETHNFEFGEFLLDMREKVLLRDGKPLPITPKAFQLLFILVENHGHLVEKDELMKSVWADSFVEEGNITFTIGLLRKLLEDDTKNPRFIETVPRRGYRFIADVRRVEIAERESERPEDKETKIGLSANFPFPLSPVSHSSNTPSSSAVVALADWRRESNENEPVEEVSSGSPKESTEQTVRFELAPTKSYSESKHALKYRVSFAAFALAAFLIGSIALGYYFYGSKRASSADGKKSIAVLPLKPINTANRDEIYEIGIADSLIHRFSSMKGFIVRPLSAIRKYADIAQDPLAAGREQQVDYVLASNYQLAGGKIRITAQLINVANGQIEETYKSEKDAANAFAMQDAIAGEVGNILSARLAATSSSPATKRGTTNEEAYRLYLQGMYFANESDQADARKAIEIFEQATRLDPNYAQAWAGKAYAHRTVANFGRSVDIHEEYRKSIEAINKALALDANLSEAQSASCENKSLYEWDFYGAESACQRAIELNPDSSQAHQTYSFFLMGRGRSDEAIAEIKTAIDLEPASLLNQRNYGLALHFARRYTEAAAQFKRVMAMDEGFGSSYQLLSNTLALSGNESEAFEWWMKMLVLAKGDKETLQAHQTAFQTSGWQGILRERAKRFEKSGEAYFHGAAFNAQIGNKEQAFEYLEKSYQRREVWMALLQVDPRLDALRDDPRFDELVRRVELK